MKHDLSAALRTLGQTVGCPVAPHVAARINSFAEGDARVLADVAKVLTPRQLRGAVALPDPLPCVDSARTEDLEQFSLAERRMLLFTAVSTSRRVADLLDAAAVEPDVLLFGRLQRHLRVESGLVAFRSDQLRSQILAECETMEQHEAHLALARVARRRDNQLAANWHGAQVVSPAGDRAARALLATANEHLRRGQVRQAGNVARLAVGSASEELAAKARATAGLASFWAGELDDAKYWFDRVSDSGDPRDTAEVNAALYARRALVTGPGRIYSAEEAAQVFRALVTAARSPSDRDALRQLSAVADAVYGRPDEADSLQARLFLSVRDAPESERLSPHAEAQIIMMQVAFQSQAGDRAGAARLLRDAIARLPMVLPAAGLVSSYLRILADFEPTFDSTLITAYEAIGPSEPLRYDGNGASIGHGPDVGAKAAAAARAVTGSAAVRPLAFELRTVTGDLLSSREHDVLALLADGRSNREISTSLGISHRTVEVHVSNILRKYGVRSRAELLALLAGLRSRQAHVPSSGSGPVDGEVHGGIAPRIGLT